MPVCTTHAAEGELVLGAVSNSLRGGSYRCIDIWPWSKAPEQLFMPAYVPWNCVIMSSMSNVPDAVAVQPAIIIDPYGIVIVNVPE